MEPSNFYNMYKILKNIITFFLFAIFLSSCGSTINLTIPSDSTVYINELRTNKKHLIKPNSKEYINFISWINLNQSGWNKGTVEWKSPYSISGNNFILLFSENFAVIKIHTNNSTIYYSKKIDEQLVKGVILR